MTRTNGPLSLAKPKTIAICCFSTKHAAWRSKIKDGLVRTQDNIIDHNMFSPWYSWQIADLVVNNNHSLTFNDITLSGVRVTRSLVLCVVFVDRCLSVCTFSFGHCVVCSSSIWYTDLDCLFDIFKLFLPFCPFFFWPLCCLFFDIRIMIAPLVSSNSSSYHQWVRNCLNNNNKNVEI